jgi:DNA-directed RNA polymerase I, II, and III subunit RPABC1
MQEDDYDDDDGAGGAGAGTGAGAAAAEDLDEAGADEPINVADMDMFRAWKTCREMVLERGYKISDESADVEPTFEQFKKLDDMERETEEGFMSIQGEKAIEESADEQEEEEEGFVSGKKKLVVKLIRGSDVKKNYLRDQCEANTITIFVITAKPTKNIISTGDEDDDCTYKYELFRYNEVIFNRTRHRLVPKHELMSKEEKKSVLKMYDCKESQIPRMLKSDFMARYYGANSGDMFKIHRPSPSCGTYITYRMVK